MPKRKPDPDSPSDSEYDEFEHEGDDDGDEFLPGPSSSKSNGRGKDNRSSTQASSVNSNRPTASPGRRLSRPASGPSVVALPRPSYTTATVGDLYDLVQQGLINLDAAYQRGIVWTAKKQEQLIDSFFGHVYIPPILFSLRMEEDGTEIRVCMDGKQRLSSIVAFMDGNIPFRDPKTNRKWFYSQNAAQTRPGREILPDYHKQLFKIKSIPIVEYSRISDAQERDIFARVQLGVALTAAEKMAASSGPWPEFIHGLLPVYTDSRRKTFEEVRLDDDSDDEDEDGRPMSGKSLDGRVIDLRRGKAYQIFSQAIHLLLEGNFTNPPPFSPASVQSQLLDRPESPSDQLSAAIVRVFNRLFHLTLIPPSPTVVPPPSATPKKKPGRPAQPRATAPTHEVFNQPALMAPVEFVFVVWAVRKFWHLNDAGLLECIGEFRSAMRAKFPNEVKQNTTVTKYATQWLLDYHPPAIPTRFPNVQNVENYAPLANVWDERKTWNVEKAKRRRSTPATKGKGKKATGAKDEDGDDDSPRAGKRVKIDALA